MQFIDKTGHACTYLINFLFLDYFFQSLILCTKFPILFLIFFQFVLWIIHDPFHNVFVNLFYYCNFIQLISLYLNL